MRAMILAAGKGKRMLPLTLTTPKPLVEYLGEPLIVHHIKALASAGITEIVINVYHLADKIIDYLKDGKQYGVKIFYSDEREIGLLETGGGVMQALPLLTDLFVLVSADIYTDFDFKQLKNTQGLAKIVLTDNPPCNPNGDFGFKDGWLTTQGEKLNYGNIALFKKEFFSGCRVEPFKLGNLLKERIQDVEGFYFSGKWDNIGTVEQLQEVKVS